MVQPSSQILNHQQLLPGDGECLKACRPMQVVERARREDLQKKIRYEVSYIKNKKGKVIIDRRFNTASLMNLYLGQGTVEEQGVSWNPDDPNRLSFQLPGTHPTPTCSTHGQCTLSLVIAASVHLTLLSLDCLRAPALGNIPVEVDSHKGHIYISWDQCC